MSEIEIQNLKQLDHLRLEHRRLDLSIEDISKNRPDAELEIGRLKKQKLAVKDQIARLEGLIYPDIIA